MKQEQMEDVKRSWMQSRNDKGPQDLILSIRSTILYDLSILTFASYNIFPSSF